MNIGLPGELSVPGQRTGSRGPEASAGGSGIPPVGVSTAVKDVGGRPSKYQGNFCEALIAHGAEGLSLNAFAGEIGVARRTLFNWAELHPEFAEAIEIAKAKACGWWEKRAKTIGDGDGGPGAASIVQFMLRNYGQEDFTDRREVAYTGAIQHNLTYEQAVEEARRRGLPERVLIADQSE
jgi:hypothetical protein